MIMTSTLNQKSLHLLSPQNILEEAIEAQRANMKGYEFQSEYLTLETVRALDQVYFKGLIPELDESPHSPQEVSIMRWGINESILRVLPKQLKDEGVPTYRSSIPVQQRSDDFIFDAGILCVAERQLALLKRGLLSGTIDPRTLGDTRILVLDTANETAYWDGIGRMGVSWLSERMSEQDRFDESILEEEYKELFPHIEKLLSGENVRGSASTINKLDQHFHEWARLYLRRMVHRELLEETDIIGGRPYGEYISIMTAISALCQMRICYARLLHQEGIDSPTNIRYMLTGVAPWAELIKALAFHIDADLREAEDILQYFTLSPSNQELHFTRKSPVWAPVIRTSQKFCLLPSYGMDINPFDFLMCELRARHNKEWFDLINRREARWAKELEALFHQPRWKCASGIKLKRDGKLVTDIDFLAYDNHTRQLALFQLKWQQPAMADNKVLNSNGKNFVPPSNAWVDGVRGWLSEFGTRELQRLVKVDEIASDGIAFFVIARYAAHIPGFPDIDRQATWSDWGHFCKRRNKEIDGSVVDLARNLQTDIDKAKSDLNPESCVLPLPGLALVINPTQRPASMNRR